ncbi:MAG: multiheme c-type cytochrome, partial [bacterium]
MQFPQIQGWILLSILLIGNPLGAAPGYIGAKQCGACHQAEYQDWQGSHHDLAMQSASEDSMLGNFDNSEFSHFNQVTRFYRKGDQYWVNTDGPNGKPADFQILYAFGVYPLQQYLVAFPGGRLQALDIAWDSRLEKEGGQRWMHLHPDQEITHEDVLHWTGPNLNWNYMCADCHSTNLLKNYDTEKQRYRTTWSEMNVACEACHGPGSAHLQWAKSDEASKSNFINKGLTTNLTERQGVTWRQTQEGTPVRSVANQQRREIEVCAVCHSRRSQLTDAHNPGDSFLDGFHPSLLDQGLYHADGQMQDEVYVWGSFLQSKMFQAGVTCSDCHDPHKAELRLPGEQVCYQCHKPEQYATPVHHHHQQDSAGSSCVECHMPPVTFMQVDARHDHGFRIPRPDQSQQMGTPNACSKCHQEQSPDWAVARLKDWYGEPDQGYQLFA